MDKEELKAILDPVISGKYHLFEIEENNKLSIKQIVENNECGVLYSKSKYCLIV